MFGGYNPRANAGNYQNDQARSQAAMYVSKGWGSLRNAVNLDRSGNYLQALRYYKDAVANFNLYLLQNIEGDDERKARVIEQRDASERRSKELERAGSMPVETPVEPAGGGQASKPKKGPSSKKSGGGGKGGKDDDDEGNEFKDRISSAILVEKPNIKWDDVAGLAEAKRNLVQAVILPMKLPDWFKGQRAPWRGILLYGPPGTGKSFLAKATATEANNSTFLTVSTSDLVSKWMGESEKLIRALFEKARENAPSIIFIDEIDSLLSERSENDSEAARRIKTEFLIQMDGVGKSMDGILLLAATNIPWGLDPAVRRRFEKKIYIPLPDKEARLALIRLKTKGENSSLTEEEINQIADMTDGYSGADINILCRDALMAPVNNLQRAEYFCMYNGAIYPCNADYPGAIRTTVLDMTEDQLKLLKPPCLCFNDFSEAIKKVRPSVAKGDLGRFEQWTSEFGQEGN